MSKANEPLEPMQIYDVQYIEFMASYERFFDSTEVKEETKKEILGWIQIAWKAGYLEGMQTALSKLGLTLSKLGLKGDDHDAASDGAEVRKP